MKVLIKKSRDQYGRPTKDGEDYHFLKIETTADLIQYASVFSEKEANANVQTLFGFNSQKFHNTVVSYLFHDSSNSSAVNRLFAFKLDRSEKNLSITDICEISDKLIISKIEGLQKIINNGDHGLVNSVGGYSSINYMGYDFDEEAEITKEEMTSFIVTRSIKVKKWDLSKKAVIVENQRSVPKTFIKDLMDLGIYDYTTITNFKRDSLLFKPEEIVTMIKEATDLKYVCFETTGLDMHQISKMATLLNVANDKLQIVISSNQREVIRIFEQYFTVHVI